MDKSKLLAIKGKIEQILGPGSDPEQAERFAAIAYLLGSPRIFTLPAGAVPWGEEQLQSAYDFLASLPVVQDQAQAIVAKTLTAQILPQVPHRHLAAPQQAELNAYIEGLVRWSLFDNRPLEEGEAIATSYPHIDEHTRWLAFRTLARLGMWRLKAIGPSLFSSPQFPLSRYDIWHFLYDCHPNFAEIYPSIRPVEVPLVPHKDWPAERSAPPPASLGTAQRPIKVAMWGTKIGNYLSSMTTVHPWLMNLEEPGLEVYILSERQTKGHDPVQDRYRQIFGTRFINCDGMSDEQFAERVIGLDLDVLCLLHESRPALSTQRLARRHLDTFCAMSVQGVPDSTLMCETMSEAGPISDSQRGFIVIPGAMHVYTRLPNVEFAERDPKSPFCFGVFNRPLKFNVHVFDVWARLLRECPNSVLFVTAFGANAAAKLSLTAELAERGINPARVTVDITQLPSEAHLARHNRVDLVLDTFPLGAGMTAVDGFHMGVPLLSLGGDKRGPALHTKAFTHILGPEAGLYAASLDEYFAYAKGLYAKGVRTKAEREKLRTITSNSVLFDAERYTKLMRKVIRVAAAGQTEQIVHVS